MYLIEFRQMMKLQIRNIIFSALAVCFFRLSIGGELLGQVPAGVDLAEKTFNANYRGCRQTGRFCFPTSGRLSLRESRLFWVIFP